LILDVDSLLLFCVLVISDSSQTKFE
jgi:hypothetical protein